MNGEFKDGDLVPDDINREDREILRTIANSLGGKTGNGFDIKTRVNRDRPENRRLDLGSIRTFDTQPQWCVYWYDETYYVAQCP